MPSLDPAPVPDPVRATLTAHLAHAGGATTRRTLNAAGLDDYQIALAAQRGDLERIRPGAYIGPGCPDASERHRRAAAAALRSHPSPLTASHESAALLLGLPTLTVPRAVQSRTETRSTTLTRAKLTLRPLVYGDRVVSAAPPSTDLRVADAAATALDIAASSGGAAGLVVADAALRGGLCSTELLADAAKRRSTWRCRRIIADVLTLASPLSESPAESRCRWLFHRLRIDQPVQQRQIRSGAVLLGRVDFLFEEQRLILEVDGAVKYTDQRALFQEKRREDALREQGYRFLRLTWRDLGQPLAVLQRLARCGVTPSA